MLVCKTYDQKIPNTGILQIKESKMSVFFAAIIRSIESDPIDFGSFV